MESIVSSRTCGAHSGSGWISSTPMLTGSMIAALSACTDGTGILRRAAWPITAPSTTQLVPAAIRSAIPRSITPPLPGTVST